MASRSGRSPRPLRVEVRKGLHGKGVFAKSTIPDDDVIGRVEGIVTDDYDLDPRYSMELDDELVLVPKGTFRYLNHSCEPNAELFVWEDGEVDDEMNSRPLYVGALRDIRSGEELTIDYGWPADTAIECMCGVKNCRGWVVDAQELPALLRQKKAEAKKAAKKKASKKSSSKKSATKKSTGKKASKKKSLKKKSAKKATSKKSSSKKASTKKKAAKKKPAKKKSSKKASKKRAGAKKRGGKRTGRR